VILSQHWHALFSSPPGPCPSLGLGLGLPPRPSATNNLLFPLSLNRIPSLPCVVGADNRSCFCFWFSAYSRARATDGYLALAVPVPMANTFLSLFLSFFLNSSELRSSPRARAHALYSILFSLPSPFQRLFSSLPCGRWRITTSPSDFGLRWSMAFGLWWVTGDIHSALTVGRG
jgi:hypothetical protein